MPIGKLLASLLLLLAFAAPASAATQKDVTTCDESKDAAEIMAACGRVIADRKQSAAARSRALYNRGASYDDKGDRTRATADYTAALRLDPKNQYAWNNRCWARAIIGRELKRALADCQRAVQLDPKDHYALDSRGFTYLKLGEIEKAIADFDAALAVEPKYANSLYGRGLMKLRKGDKSGDADIEAAKKIQANIAEMYAKYGVK